ncbi:MAG: hypothetical protein KC506_02300 [Nanoarchaeota archaeon]|nr:hypothetical protein [Nanoarchaeota archaeon]
MDEGYNQLRSDFENLVSEVGKGTASIGDVENFGRRIEEISPKAYIGERRARLGSMANSLYGLAAFIDVNAQIPVVEIHPVEDRRKYIPSENNLD